jgi:hypothetical protein
VKSRKSPRMARPSKGTGPSIDQRVLALLGTAPLAPRAVAEKLQAPLNVINLTLGRLASQHKAQKNTDGTYALPKAS